MWMLNAGARLARHLPAETAHSAGLHGLATAARLGVIPAPSEPDPRLHTQIASLNLPNPVGLAAGFDKDSRAPDALLQLGFGFVEMGTVTPRPQPGNERPRLFRLAEDHAVINRFGFNSRGLETTAKRLSARENRPGVVGANVGANKDSTDRAADYVKGITRLWGLADYFTVNISSPNTPGLRDLQGGDALDDLLARVEEARLGLAGEGPSAPVFLKVAPDLDDGAIERIAQTARAHAIDGLIISNTTIERPNSLTSAARGETGGLSGRPLFARSTEVLAAFFAACQGQMPLIGVGGVEDGRTAYAKIRAGASAVQLYSALVYHGPRLPRRIAAELAALLKADGFSSITEAVGVEAR